MSGPDGRPYPVALARATKAENRGGMGHLDAPRAVAKAERDLVPPARRRAHYTWKGNRTVERTISTPKGTIAVRRAGEQDAMAYRELRLEALRDHPEAYASDYESNADRPPSFWQDRLRGDQADMESATYWAVHGQEPVGIGGIVRDKRVKTQHSGTIVGVYVRPAWRGLHVAEALVMAGLDWAAAQELSIVKLAVVTTNVAAIRCYARCGFQVYGVEPQVLRLPDGSSYDELLMARQR